MAKAAVVAVVALAVWWFEFPLLHWWREWLQDVYRFSVDPAFAASYSTSAKAFYAVYPLVFIVAGLLWYAIVWSQHRKTYYACGWAQGTVMWVFNKPGEARGHIYDLWSALNGFRVIPWEDIPRPFTGHFFDGKTVIYWRSSFWQSPFSWNKDYIPHPERDFRETMLTVYAVTDRRYNFRHRFNPKCDFNYLTGRDLLDRADKSLTTSIEREKSLNYQITEDVQRLARANPDVANDMAHRDIPIPRKTREKLIAAKEAKRHGEERKDPVGPDAFASD